MNYLKDKWSNALGIPSYEVSGGKIELITKYSREEFDVELFRQENGGGKHQRVMVVIPKELKDPAPAIAVPFYFPEAMLGFDPKTNEELENYKNIEMMLHLVRRGYIAACADAYHLTYMENKEEFTGFDLWQHAADKLRSENPGYSGMGKLFDDTKLLVDMLYNDARVDKTRIGIAGHSLGGKMAFYTGCLDERISAILASDFGIGWEQTNWHKDWYWGDKLQELIKSGMDHAELLSIAAPKPFCLLAGKFDNDESRGIMKKASGYENTPERLKFINHKEGHRPPLWALEEGYNFLDRWVKNKV